MFEKFWKTRSDPHSSQRKTVTHFDGERLKLLVTHFPIGRKLLYYPEYHRKAVLHTIVIAYRVNGHYLYTNDGILRDEDDVPRAFMLEDGRMLPVEKLTSLEMLIPDTSEMERQLDYITRAELGPAGQFRKGNTITLVAENVERCLPSIDTIVERRQVIDDGPYANSPTILVEPELASLKIVDKRHHQRVQAALWADLYYAKETPPFRCVLRDFSENSLRLSVSDEAAHMPPMRNDGPVVVEFDFGSIETTYRIRGRTMRSEEECCVVQIEQMYRDADFEKIRPMDIIEIKTRLLNSRR